MNVPTIWKDLPRIPLPQVPLMSQMPPPPMEARTRLLCSRGGHVGEEALERPVQERVREGREGDEGDDVVKRGAPEEEEALDSPYHEAGASNPLLGEPVNDAPGRDAQHHADDAGDEHHRPPLLHVEADDLTRPDDPEPAHQRCEEYPRRDEEGEGPELPGHLVEDAEDAPVGLRDEVRYLPQGEVKGFRVLNGLPEILEPEEGYDRGDEEPRKIEPPDGLLNALRLYEPAPHHRGGEAEGAWDVHRRHEAYAPLLGGMESAMSACLAGK